MGKIYTINSGGTEPDGSDLVGLQIRDFGNGYELVKVLGTSSTKSPPFSFTFQGYDGWDWTVTATSKSDQGSTPTMSGTWSNTDPDNSRIEGEEDSWTATGTGNTEGEDDAQSASA